MELNEISGAIIGAAIAVHKALGPGLLENAYKVCLAHELRKRGLHVQTELELPVVYDGVKVDLGYRLDMLVQDAVIVEIKAVYELHPIHEAQLLSYLKLGNKKLGLLINFNVRKLTDGVKRMVN